jgi:serine/threonine-protein kinase
MGTSNDELLSAEPGPAMPTDWSVDDRFVAFNRGAGFPAGASTDVWALPLVGDKKPFAVASTRFTEMGGVFSPDRRWIAYESNETGQTEVYAQPFPPTGGRYQVSSAGGRHPTWRPDGKELFFLAPPDARLMSVSVVSGQQLELGKPVRLFTTNASAISGRQYAVSRDGTRFLVNTQMQHGSGEPITVVVNWLAAATK